MNKILFTMIILLTSCNGVQPDYIQGKSNDWQTDPIVYFKDKRTGLCFAERGATSNYSFTCVPCDSLKKLNLFNYE
jgi:hypothetical protein